MDPAVLELTVLGVVFVALVGLLVGVFGVMSRGKRAGLRHIAVLGFGGLLAVCGYAAISQGLPRSVWVAVLALAGACLGLVALQFGFVRGLAGNCLAMLSGSRLPSVALLVACPLVATWCYLQLTPPDDPFAVLNTPIQPDKMTEVAAVHAVTDRGARLPVYAVSAEDQASVGPSLNDSNLVRERAAKLIRTAGPDLSHNCHGWVFTAGQHWVKGRDVDPILKDNGYEITTEPRVGDVIVYRDATGLVLHTGLVRLVEGDLVLIESKWGALGRYVHRPEEQCYGDRFDYYRSARDSHSLVGLSSTPSPNPARPRARRAG